MYQENAHGASGAEFEVPSFTDAPAAVVMRTLWSARGPRLEAGGQPARTRNSIGQRVASPERLPTAAMLGLPTPTGSPAPTGVHAGPATRPGARPASRTERSPAQTRAGGSAPCGHFRPSREPDGRIRLELRSSAHVSLLRSRLEDETRIEEAAERIRQQCADADAFAIRELDDGRWRFDLIDVDGERLASSRPFASEALARATVKLAQLHGPRASCEPIPASGQILQA